MKLRFLSTKGFHVTIDVADGITVGDAKQRLYDQWPEDFPGRPDTSDQVKFVYSGSFLKNDQLVQDIRSVTDEITVHVIVPKPAPVEVADEPDPDAPQYTHTNGTKVFAENGEVVLNEEAYFHFHGCTVSEEEVEQMMMVYEKKRDPETSRVPFDRVHSFLRTYWRYSKAKEMIDQDRPFPTRKMLGLHRRVLRSDEGGAPEAPAELARTSLTRDQFLELFFLFDNTAPTTACPHGAKSRVQRATEQLHAQIQTQTALHVRDEELAAAAAAAAASETEGDSEGADLPPVPEPVPFDEALFNSLFQAVCTDTESSVLTCQEVDLIYYLYSAKIMLKHPAPELGGTDSDDDAGNQQHVEPATAKAQ